MQLQILLIRHGATAGNLEGRYIGRTDEPLPDSSREQLRRIREKGIFPAPDRVYTSPMLRCRETAEILFPDKKAAAVRAFAECDFGEFEGKNYAELNGDPAYQAFIDSGGELPFPGGESRAEVEARVVRGFCEVLGLREEEIKMFLPGKMMNREKEGASAGWERREDSPLFAFVVHGGTVMSILHHFLGGDPFSWRIGNGEGVLVTGLCGSADEKSPDSP